MTAPSRFRTHALGGAVALSMIAGSAAHVFTSGGCVDLTPNTVQCPPFPDFAAVSPLLERRCGTLDCHGNTARPMRIYGQYGLRYAGGGEGGAGGGDSSLFSGNLNAPTTPTEVERNYFAVCGLEPEKMSFVQAGEAAPETLTVVRKPRLTEKHKGGRIWDKGKVEDRCLVNWIQGDYDEGMMDKTDCLDAVTP